MKIKTVTLILFLVLISLPVFADFTIPDGWVTSAIPSGNSGVEFNGNGISLWFNTNNGEGKASADRNFAFSEDVICVSLTAEIEGRDTRNYRKVIIQNEGTFNITDLLNFKGESLEAFGTVISDNIMENTTYDVLVAVNCKTKDAVVWLDGEIKYSGNLGSKWKSFDYSNLQLELKNYTFPKITALNSNFLIKRLSVSNKGNNITSLPSNNDNLVDISKANKINLYFGGQKGHMMYKTNNYTLLENNIEKSFDITVADNGINIIPSDGFIQDSNYKLIIKKDSDVFGNIVNENVEMSFHTAPAGYIAPVIKINNGDITKWEGETVVITSEVVSSTVISKVVYFVNGVQRKEVIQGEEYSFELTESAGVYNIKAIAYDNLGGYSNEDVITVTFVKNDLPTVSIENITDGGKYSSENLKNIVILAEDNEGEIVSVDVFVNRNHYTTLYTAPYTVDLSGIGKGFQNITLKATDNANTNAQKDYCIIVSGDLQNTVTWENDLENYVSDGAARPSGMVGGALYGDCKLKSSKDYGKEHGTVMVMETEGGQVDGKSASGSWFNVPTSNATNKFILEMDVNILVKQTQYYFLLVQRIDGNLYTTGDIGFNDLVFYAKNGKKGSANVNYETGKWYKIKYEVDLGKKTYDLYLDGTQIADDFEIGNSALTQVETRFVMTLGTAQKAGVVFDNFKLTFVNEEPVISSISYDSVLKCEKVSPYAQTIKVFLTAPVSEASVTKDSVKLYIGNEEIALESVSYSSGVISIKPLEAIRSNVRYTVKLSSALQNSDGRPLSEELTGYFITDTYSLDMINSKVISDGTKAYAVGTIINSTGVQKTVYIVLTVWENDQMCDITVEKVISTGTITFKTDHVLKNKKQQAEIYVWDSLTQPMSVTSGIN